ncbi:phosphocholine cytidylyltransferase family protein [Sulfuricurvum sp. RIFCSPLOWO2_12_FULL_43_24]|uniref:phosphocholine cytidylyltransferase family protein n=1 Tax=Sulfuricurvum sp. RIFCSPLOWO2_12_FULL_43_24 TaxID=1802247 RepID=UPI0008CEEA61|nr:phosphocholine cytidylyltransferase family protein [Sulfuricurvum sp. RIFCSPLOWO2_12_FULL_43_24]OHD90008.1 MAG: sugar nucleotidyltransferase [Sulfuricurvum sp. RIFCSPLOWO2_12_FULL_43_24]
MKAIILAAGQGTRLRPLTDDRPKCMVEYKGKSIITTILETMHNCGIEDIAIVGGYKIDVLKEYLKDQTIVFFENKEYEKTNMVSTFFCAEEWMDDDLIISYADIMYTDSLLQKVLSEPSPISTSVDLEWLELWKCRMDNPLADAETMKLDDFGNIVELGKKPKSYDEIHGQYMGLIKIKKELIGEIVEFYATLSRDAMYDGKSFTQMYMTSFLQMIIDHIMPIKAVLVHGGWIEIDCVQDMESEMFIP